MSLTPTDPSRSGDNSIPEQPMELDAQIERVSSLKRAFPESSSETSVEKTRHYSLQEVQNLVKVSQLVENFLADSNLMGIDPDQELTKTVSDLIDVLTHPPTGTLTEDQIDKRTFRSY